MAIITADIASYFVTEKTEVLDLMKSLPDSSMAEDLDFEVWGKAFCEKLVCHPFWLCEVFSF